MFLVSKNSSNTIITTSFADVGKCHRDNTPAGHTYIGVFTQDELPDFYFKEAWVCENNLIIVDIEKAKEVHINRLRARRDTLLEQTDIKFMKHFGDETALAPILALKSELRGMPTVALSEMSSLDTPEQIKAYLPTCLSNGID